MDRRLSLSLLLLSASTLAFEINLTRLFSVAQFYHFAFLVVSLALLGFGAGGAALAIFPNLGRGDPRRSLGRLSLAAGASMPAAYLLTNWLPFDSFSIAVDGRQFLLLALHYLALASPFFFSGMAGGLLLEAFPQSAGRTYAVNLLGAAGGCALALAAPSLVGGEGMVTLAGGLAALAALCAFTVRRAVPALPAAALLVFSLLDLALRLAGRPLPLLDLQLSPYKGLSYALQYPDAEIVYRRWNAFSRLDVVRSGGIHSLPGLSYRYRRPLPAQDGLLVDGDDLSAVLSPQEDLQFTDYLPSAAAFHLRPATEALILEPRGGLDILTALALGATSVTVVEANPLIVEASPVYRDPRLRVIVESDRSYLRRAGERYGVIILSLASSYHPVRSGAYALSEDYRFTVEAFEDILARLKPGGVFLVTRWLQDPPSEDLRAFALAVTAVERSGGDPRRQIVAFRGYNTGTIVVKNGVYTAEELALVREFADRRAFDLTYLPGIRPEETNRHNILPESTYHQTYTALLESSPRAQFYQSYPFDVAPPTDDRPFFGHYFKWSQAPQVLTGLGKTWQPFGGAGYFVILGLLALSVLLAALLILLPLAFRRAQSARAAAGRQAALPLLYFTFIGLAFMLVEIPLIQRFILYLGHPAYAMTAVLFSILLFSALGSRLSRRIPLLPALAALTVLLLSLPGWLPGVLAQTLGLPLGLRLAFTALLLAPIGLLMGIPLPGGIRQWDQTAAIPWFWAANGAASVVASVLAALLALSFGFLWVLRIGALCYLTAGFTALARRRPAPSSRPRR